MLRKMMFLYLKGGKYDDNHYLPPPIPLNEVERRKALWRFQILNTSNDVNFTRIVALSKEHFKTSISMISLLNTTHQWFKVEDDPQRQFEEEERDYLSNFGINIVNEVLKRKVIIADRAKGAFVSSISHELRNPLQRSN
ncbi:10039_t:CDS:2 [Rhizophagus irregularis]|nr:10039_t:CDS:2 [Rhizophagus irregularis]